MESVGGIGGSRCVFGMRGVLGAIALALSAGCTVDASSGEDESVDSLNQALGVAHLLTGNGASETAVSNVGTDGTMVMSANKDDVAPFQTFPNGVRRIIPGVTLMGYTRYNPSTNTILAQDRIVLPPSGWSALWGDPGVTRNRFNSNNMYITNLAIPSNKFPSSGEILGPVNPSGLPANFCGAYIGGACIARSSNSGSTFSLTASNCVQRVSAACPFGTFYDGSDLDSDTAGRAHAAFNDVNRSRIDVYMANSPGNPFNRITDPTPVASLHPRLRNGPGGLYLLVQSGSNLVITRYNGGSSLTGTWSTPVTVTTGITASDVNLSDRTIRLGPQYDLDIGPDENGVQVARVVYTVLVNGKHKVRVNQCSTGATITCTHPGAWQTDSAGGEQWNPNIITGVRANGNRFWSLSFYDNRNNATGNRVELWAGTVSLQSGQSSMSTFRQELPQTPCPDLRGYWGDYDDMNVGPSGMVYRGFTDSSHGTCSRAQYDASPMNAALSKWTL